jgi:hypothetical protein
MSQCQRHNPARNNRGLLIDPDGGADLFDDDEVLDCGKPVNFTYYDHLGKKISCLDHLVLSNQLVGLTACLDSPTVIINYDKEIFFIYIKEKCVLFPCLKG